jgi:tetratricopeptide (TPR) repeat protein
MLGRCQLALDQHGDALDNLRKAAELAPGDPANAASLSRALVALDRYSEALELLEGLGLETLSPAWKAEFSRLRARCLLADDRAAEAVAVLQECLQDNQDNAALHRAIAAAYQAVGDRPEILDHLARAFSLDPVDQSSGRAAVKLALALAAAASSDDLAAGYRARALELAAELMTAAPSYENALLAGEAAGAANHLSEAANWYAAAVQERPQEPVARYRFACTLAALDRSDEAIDQLRAALGAAPDAGLAARIHGQLGRLLACRLELPEAARHYRAAGDDSRAAMIDELAERYDEAFARLASLRNDSSELAGIGRRAGGSR